MQGQETKSETHLTCALPARGAPPEHREIGANFQIAACVTLVDAFAGFERALRVELAPHLELLGVELPFKGLCGHFCSAH